MAFPYQRLETFGKVLVAASLSRLDFLSLEDGSLLSSWTCLNSSGETNLAGLGKEDSELLARQHGLPTKKKRPSSHNEKEKSAQNVNKPATRQLDSATGRSEGPVFIALSSTKSGEHVIGVTADDKTIRVLKHDTRTGLVEQLSQRAMPKRPCAVVLSNDESTIICADKFGDLYSLPLLIPHGSVNQKYLTKPPNPNPPSPAASKSFTPAANDFTVHTVRNRKALENQLRQTQQAAEKPEAHSGQTLLLGHVSMLTDIALVELGGHSYIVTADRDEHIRISRGIPQAHIIENYCLGHTEFVSRLCVPVTYPNLLISGGGEDEIYIWDWLAGKILQKVNIRGQLERDILGTDQGLDAAVNINVTYAHLCLPTNIVVANISHIVKGQNMQSDQIVVACEGIPALLIYSLSQNATLSHLQTILLTGNPLDLLVDYSHTKLIVSLDTIHEPGTTSKLRTNLDSTVQRLLVFRMRDGSKWTNECLQFTEPAPKGPGEDLPGKYDSLSSLFYSLKNLRKCGGEE